MPRMSKKMKQEWALFIGPGGRRQYNELCRRCQKECKQSYRVIVERCPSYISKRARVCN